MVEFFHTGGCDGDDDDGAVNFVLEEYRDNWRMNNEDVKGNKCDKMLVY